MGEPFNQAKAIFLRAIEEYKPEQWPAFLERACAGDARLRTEVERLLRARSEMGSFHEATRPVLLATIDEPISERAGTIIGPYKLLEQIGEGGFGVVFMAEQMQPVRRKVALKVLKPGMDTRQVIARFEAERQALALMDHPNIAHVFDGGETITGRPYFVMELVRGIPVTEFCDQSCLSIRQRLELFVYVCQAVQHAHQKGIIHRDLKPSNVMVTLHDGTPVVKVIDFGIAKATGQRLTDKTLFTGFAQMLGTPLYMSPEQAGQSGLDVDTRSDIYSLGVLLYELLTGTTPFDKERFRRVGYDEMRRIIREEEPPRPSTRLSTLGQAAITVSTRRESDPRRLSQLFRGELDWVVMKALEKDRNRRYESASTFAADVQRYLNDEPVLACPPSAWYRLRKFARRNRGRLAAAAVLGLALLVAVSGIGWAVLDRANRRAKLIDQAELILQDVNRLEREQKWPEALAAVERAEAALTGGEADHAIQRRLADVRRDVDFVVRLERIRQDRATIVEAKFNNRGAVQDYALAFRAYGVDIEALPVDEAVARLQANPALVMPIAAALDDWVAARRRLGEREPNWRPLVALARRLDADPLRDRLRAVWRRPVTPELRAELRRLADSIDVKAESPTTIQLLARTANSAHLADAAIQTLQRGQQVHPADFWLNFDLGFLLFNARKDYVEAVRHLSVAVSLRPDNANAHNSLGAALAKLGRYRDAEAAFRKALQLNHADSLAYRNLGGALTAQGKYKEGESACREALRLKQDDPHAYNNLGYALFHQRRHPEAETAFREVLGLLPDYPEAHTGLGAVLNAQGQHKEAEAAYHEALRLKPDYFEAHHNLGVALAAQGKHQEAEAAYHEAIRLKPDFRTYNDLGALLHDHLRRYREAEKAFREAIRLEPNEPLSHFNLGNTLNSQGKQKEAEAAYREAIRLKPDYPEANNNLADLLTNALDPKQRDGLQAVTFAQRAVKAMPNNGDFWNTLGAAYYRAESWEQAIAALGRAMKLRQGGDSSDWFFLAMAYWQLGNKEKANQWFDLAIPWMDKNQPTNETLRRLRDEAAELLARKEKK